MVVKAIALQPKRDRGVLHGPYRTEVVGERVVRGMVAGEGPDPPSREQIARQQPIGDGGRVLGRHHPHAERVPDIRGDRPHLLVRRIERHRVEPLLAHPEGVVPCSAQRCGPMEEAVDLIGALIQRHEHLCHPLERHVVEGLFLDGRDGILDDAPVRVADGLVRSPSSPGSSGHRATAADIPGSRPGRHRRRSRPTRSCGPQRRDGAGAARRHRSNATAR